jgi:hypothetical protein
MRSDVGRKAPSYRESLFHNSAKSSRKCAIGRPQSPLRAGRASPIQPSFSSFPTKPALRDWINLPALPIPSLQQRRVAWPPGLLVT